MSTWLSPIRCLTYILCLYMGAVYILFCFFLCFLYFFYFVFFLVYIWPEPEQGSPSGKAPLHPNVQPLGKPFPEALSSRHLIPFFVSLDDKLLFYHLVQRGALVMMAALGSAQAIMRSKGLHFKGITKGFSSSSSGRCLLVEPSAWRFSWSRPSWSPWRVPSPFWESSLFSEAARPLPRLGVGVLSEMNDKTVFNDDDDHSGCCVFVAVMCYNSVTVNVCVAGTHTYARTHHVWSTTHFMHVFLSGCVKVWRV